MRKNKQKPFKLLLQLHGSSSKSSTTKTAEYTPTAQELALQNQALSNAQTVNPYVLNAAEIGNNLLSNNYGTQSVDYESLANSALGELSSAQSGITDLTQGTLPSAYLQNMTDSIQNTLTNTLGTSINSLGNRGVLNSSVTTAANNSIASETADSVAQNYLNNISALSNLYQNQVSNAGQGISLSSAAQQAALYPTTTLWNNASTLNQGVGTLGALNAIKGTGTQTTTNSSDSNTMSELLKYGTIVAASMNCFTGDTGISVPSEEPGGISPTTPICLMKVGDKLWAYDEANDKFGVEEVTDVMEPRYEDVWEIRTDRNFTVTAPMVQPFLLEDNSYKVLQTLCIGDELKDTGKVKSITYRDRQKVYDVKFTGKANNYVANGFIVRMNNW